MQQESDPAHLEIEVKFRVENRSDMADRILRSGGVLVSDGFETNIRWDDISGSLAAKKSLLRLRTESGGRAILTFKSPPPVDEVQFKVFIERELVVGDAGEMAAILEALGFHPVQIYEKERTVFRFDDVTLCLDRLPFGDFLEIEGEKEAIRHAAERLGLNWEMRILDNYLGLFEKVRQSMGLPFSDVTFANFKGIQVDNTLLS
jgi:adenylate cyclase class 2